MDNGSFSPDYTQIPDPRAPEFAGAALAWLAGSYSTGWPLLKLAAYSSAISASHATARTIALCNRILERGPSPGEASFLTDVNYWSAMLGPSMGAVVLSSLAVESFIRLGFVVHLELKHARTRTERSQGFTEYMAEELASFDGLSAMDRVRELRRRVRSDFDSGIEYAAQDLIGFRNSLAHDLPTLWTVSGEMLTPTRKPAGRNRSRSKYERLTESQRPVRPKHVVAAIRAHDGLVSHTLNTARHQRWGERVRELAVGSARIQDHMRGKGNWWKDLRTLARAWETGPQAVMDASPSQIYDFRQEFQRKMTLRIVK